MVPLHKSKALHIRLPLTLVEEGEEEEGEEGEEEEGKEHVSLYFPDVMSKYIYFW